MTWHMVTIYVWLCDLCGAESTETDDCVPEGWVADQVGHHRCPGCLDVACGCDEGACRVTA